MGLYHTLSERLAMVIEQAVPCSQPTMAKMTRCKRTN